MIITEHDGVTYVSPETAEDVTEEILQIAEETYDGWFDDDQPIDWEEFIDRMCKEGYLSDETRLEFEEYDNPAVRKIQRHVRAYRRGEL